MNWERATLLHQLSMTVGVECLLLWSTEVKGGIPVGLHVTFCVCDTRPVPDPPPRPGSARPSVLLGSWG